MTAKAPFAPERRFDQRTFNNILTVIVVLLGFYIVLSPFIPELLFRYKKFTDTTGGVPYSGQLDGTPKAQAKPPKDNRIVIPSLQLDEPIKDSKSIDVISDGGTWRRPRSSTPDKVGNTVIVGHRFYGPAGLASSFYHLDKLAVGDFMAVYWKGQETIYRVFSVNTVDDSAIEIEANTTDRRLTLYTCTPLWTAKYRLVVVALPVEIKET